MASATAAQLRRLESLEKRILTEIKNVEMLERRITGEEEEIVEQGKEVISGIKKLTHWRDAFVRNFSQQHRIFFNTILTMAVILISRGVWELSATVPFLSSSAISLLVGVGMLVLINRFPNPA